MPEPTSASVTLRAQREQTIRVLCDHFAADDLEVAEFERRLDVAHRATRSAELEALTADLVRVTTPSAAAPAPAPPRPTPAAGASVAAAPSRMSRARQVIAGILGGATRRGRWLPARQSTAIAVMGGVVLDFREAQLPPGETVVHAFAIWGGVSIVVPPELEVAVNGVGIMGGFDHRGHAGTSPSPDAPRLRIDGVALMGGVDVQVRAAGECFAGLYAGMRHERHARLHELRAHRRELREEARRLRSEWRGRR